MTTAPLPWTAPVTCRVPAGHGDRKSTRLNSSHTVISYAVFCLKKKEHTSELQSHSDLVCRLLLEKKKQEYCIQDIECIRHNASHRGTQMFRDKLIETSPLQYC